MKNNKPGAMLLLPPAKRDIIYGAENTHNLTELVNLTDCCHLCGDFEGLKPYLESTEIICSGWGMMHLDAQFLAAAPALKALFYGAGSVRGFITDAVWERGILVTSAWAANAIPVAETTVALIMLCLKKAFLCQRLTCEKRTWMRADNIKGVYGANIGLIGLGAIGRKVLEILQSYDLNVFCYDPNVDDSAAKKLGCEKMDIAELFRTCDVISLHAPNIPSTQDMVRGVHFQSMKEGAAFINTARGKIVNEGEMIDELKKGRIFACLDVTFPEPPREESPLYDLENVFLTPHIAGSLGEECKRMGAYVVEEVRRYLNSRPPAYQVTEKMMQWMA